MSNEEHHAALERMYLAGPINRIYRPSISVDDATATIEMDVDERFFHAAGAMHGSVYFKMLDDAAFFAVNSTVPDVFVLTTSFTTYLTRPVSSGRIRSVGTVVSRSRTLFIAEAVVYDDRDKEIGRGSGTFVRSRLPLTDAAGYGEDRDESREEGEGLQDQD
jgi:uncharacterized protein (TIGR00369 family)